MAYEVSWDAFSKEDIDAILAGRYDQVSEPGLRLLTNNPYESGESFQRGVERGFTSTLRGVAELFGADKTQDDIEREREYRAMLELNPGATISGSVVGGLTDPTNLAPIGTAKTFGQFVGQGIAVGGVAGVLEPTYTAAQEGGYDDSRLQNVGVGAAFGGVVGAGLGKLLTRSAGKEDQLATDLVSNAQAELQAALTNPGDKSKFLGASLDTLLQRKAEALKGTGEVPVQPTTSVEGAVQAVTNIQGEKALPTLDPQLRAAQNMFGRTPMAFSNDIDMAAYIAGKGTSTSSGKYLGFLARALNLPVSDAQKLAKEAYNEMKKSNGQYLVQMGLKGENAAQLPVRTSRAIDRIINPVDKFLDNESKVVYNYGSKMLEQEGKGKWKINASDTNLKNIHAKLLETDPNAGVIDAAKAAFGYARGLRHMKNEFGPTFKARSFDDYLKNAGDDNDMLLSILKSGDIDGCPI